MAFQFLMHVASFRTPAWRECFTASRIVRVCRHAEGTLVVLLSECASLLSFCCERVSPRGKIALCALYRLDKEGQEELNMDPSPRTVCILPSLVPQMAPRLQPLESQRDLPSSSITYQNRLGRECTVKGSKYENAYGLPGAPSLQRNVRYGQKRGQSSLVCSWRQSQHQLPVRVLRSRGTPLHKQPLKR